MKKKVYLLAITIILGASFGMQPAKASPEFISEIRGTVTENDAPVNDPVIAIDCYGNAAKFHGKSDGTYSIHLKDCWKGKLVKVVAFAKDATGKYTKVGYGKATGEDVTTIDVQIMPEYSIPEYSPAGALTALGLVGGMIYLLRRRKQVTTVYRN